MKQGLNNSSNHAQSHIDMVNEEIDLFESEKPLSKGEKLAILMDCSERLHKRWIAAWEAYHALPENYFKRIEAFKKVNAINRASARVTRKITYLLDEQS
jgi:hypothetical protein